jgi:2-isopropylmalate synthase
VHAAAVIKALRTGDLELAKLVYSAVPSHWFGLEELTEVGPMCGRSNVLCWLEKHGMAVDEDVVVRIFERAKSSDHVVTEQEIIAAIEDSGQ